MSLSSNDLVMPVSPMGSYGGYGNGFGSDSCWWVILLLLALGNGGFGGGFGGYGGGYDFPWILSGQQGINNNTNEGFRDQMINNNVTSIRDSIGNLSTQLCDVGSRTGC